MAVKNARVGLRSFQITDEVAGGTFALDVGGSASVELSGEVRETLESATNATPGYRVTYARGRMEVEIIDSNEVLLSNVQAMSDVTAIITTVSGKTYAAKGWLVEAPSLDLVNGTVTLAIEGTVTERVVS